jgi:hypothetical protein
VDFRGADFEFGTFRLELAIPKFTFDFHKCAFLQAGGPSAQLRPDNTGVPLRPRPVFAGILVLPADVGCDREPGVGRSFVVKRVSASFPSCPMRVMRFLQNIFVISFFVPFSVGATRSEGPAPQGQGRIVAGDLQGEPAKQSPAARRAQSFDPKPSPTEKG